MNAQIDKPRAPRPQLARRGVVLGALALGAGAWMFWPMGDAAAIISAPDAFAAARDARLTLIDIRRPDEWQRTGIGQGAHPLDMRAKDFETALSQILAGDRTRPLAVICARGVRSRRLAARLARAGFTNIVDVSEGMEGSGAGPGWVERGLPVRQP